MALAVLFDSRPASTELPQRPGLLRGQQESIAGVNEKLTSGRSKSPQVAFRLVSCGQSLVLRRI
jgi:hypothetical protein